MELRKREKPTATLMLQRDELISRATKRQRHGPMMSSGRKLESAPSSASVLAEDGLEDDDMDDDNEPESDVDPDYQDAHAGHARARGRGGGRGRGRGRRTRTDRGLTFLQTARERNIPVRSGKWNDAEEQYLRKLVSLFNAGLLEESESKVSMRLWLSKMLSCCPMRISKKQSHGEKFKGKSKYARNRDRIANMTQREFLNHWYEVGTLRANFLHQWARDEFLKWCGTSHVEHFEDWYTNIVERLPTPELAMGPQHKKPTQVIPMPLWDTIRREVVELEMTKVAQRIPRTSQNEESESENENEAEDSESEAASSQCSVLEDRRLCQESCCTISEADMALLANEELSEPSQLYEMELSVETWATEDEVWEVCDSTPPIKYIGAGGRDVQSTIVLDFGPPSLWNSDVAAKDTSSPPSSSEWVDDLLSEDTLLAFDPSMLLLADVSSDLPTEAWFQQLTAPLQL